MTYMMKLSLQEIVTVKEGLRLLVKASKSSTVKKSRQQVLDMFANIEDPPDLTVWLDRETLDQVQKKENDHDLYDGSITT